MVRVGVQSIPIVSLVVFCIGAILALQMAPILERLRRRRRRSPTSSSIAMFRELGPLVSAIVLTGFAGASIAAEIGHDGRLRGNRSPGGAGDQPDPVPRRPARAGDDGHDDLPRRRRRPDGRRRRDDRRPSCSSASASCSTSTHTFDAVKIKDFITGLVKAGVFGALISSLACYLGLGVTGGARASATRRRGRSC